MTQSEPSQTRTNRSGDPCPPWCAVDHAKIGAHISSPMDDGKSQVFEARVTLVQGTGERRPYIDVMKIADNIQFDFRDADDFAALFEALAGENRPARTLHRLAAEMRTAAAIAREAQRPGPCGLCRLRAERGIQAPEGGCPCQAAAAAGEPR